jgi:hypothetical protein
MKLNIYELFGENCMSQQAGQRLYEKIHPALQRGQLVELDFAGVKRFLSVFFNFAIGQLLRDINPDTLDRLLTVSNLTPVGQQTYEHVMENAKRYYSDSPYRQAVDEMIEEQSLCL